MRALLTGGYGYGKARAFRSAVPGASIFLKGRTPVVKPEWGTKRTCPKCGTRFYDLQQEEPVTCIECSTQWVPEPILKSKQPLPFDAPKPEADKKVADEHVARTDRAEHDGKFQARRPALHNHLLG